MARCQKQNEESENERISRVIVMLLYHFVMFMSFSLRVSASVMLPFFCPLQSFASENEDKNHFASPTT